MNPLTNVKNINKLNETEANLGIAPSKSWHKQYKDSAWIFIGGLPYDLTEGDILCVFSQYGEIVNINLVRDKKTGKQKGFCFICYEDQRSTVLAVDNLNGIKLLGRILRVDHVADYRPPKEDEGDDELTKKIRMEGVAPKTPPPSSSSEEEEVYEVRVKKMKKDTSDKPSKKKGKKEKREKETRQKKKEKSDDWRKEQKNKSTNKTDIKHGHDSESDNSDDDPQERKPNYKHDDSKDNREYNEKTSRVLHTRKDHSKSGLRESPREKDYQPREYSRKEEPHRERDRGAHRDSYRGSHRDRDMGRDRHRDAERDRDYGRYRYKDSDRERDRYSERGRDRNR